MLQERSVMSVEEANMLISKEFKIGKRNEDGLFPIYKVDTSSHMIARDRGKKRWELFAHAKTLEQAVDITKGIAEQDYSNVGLREE
jgi:hypothetical protein